MDRPLATVVVAGLTVAWLLGLGGTVLESGSTGRAALWVTSSIGWDLATGILTVWFVRTDRLVMAAGCLVLTIGEVVIHAQGPESVDAFAATTYAYVVGLLLTAASDWPPLWTRITSGAGAVAFGVHAVQYLGGNTLGPDNTPAGIGYGMITLTFIGWSLRLLRGTADDG